jgi:hypothetical protein
MARVRVPAHITESVSHDFGLNVKVNPLIRDKVEEYPAGNPEMEGMQAPPEPHGNYPYREVIPPGVIGSQEDRDPSRPGKQYVDTVAYYETEQNDPTLHGPLEALKSADRAVPFQPYPDFQPRSAAIPRAAQDEGYLETYDRLAADPLMTDWDSNTLIHPRDARRKDLFGDNRAGMLHNDNEPTEAQKAALTRVRGMQAGQMGHEEAKKYVQGSADVDRNYPGVELQTDLTARKQQKEKAGM